MLNLANLNVSIGGSLILRNVALEVPKSQVVCLMGRNGVGKTTTLRTIVGLRKPSSGSIELDSRNILPLGPDQRARAGIGYVPQGREIFPNLTVFENLKIGCREGNKALQSRLERVYELFPVLKEMLARKGGVLSGGQQQQLAIGRALVTEPKLLILDEPTEGIQPNIIDQIGEAILRLKGTMSILLVEQYLDFARELADAFYIMDRGSVVARGAIGQLTEEVVRQHLVV